MRNPITASKRYLQQHPQHHRRGLCPLPDGVVLLRPDPGHHPRSGEVRARHPGAAGAGPALSELRIRRGRQARSSRSPATSSPARSWRSAASTCRSAIMPAPSTASARWFRATRRPATWKRRSSVSPRPIWPWASSARRRPPPRFSATTSPTAPWYKDAHALLTKGGVEPREDSQSWISKAFRGVPQVGQRTG